MRQTATTINVLTTITFCNITSAEYSYGHITGNTANRPIESLTAQDRFPWIATTSSSSCRTGSKILSYPIYSWTEHPVIQGKIARFGIRGIPRIVCDEEKATVLRGNALQESETKVR